MNYQDLKIYEAPMMDCFFAFSDAQFDEGVERFNLQGQKIYSAGAGLYGTRSGLAAFFKDYEIHHNRITNECEPQEVYDYEFDNYECSLILDDTEAIKAVIAFFGDERAATVKRRYACTPISELEY